MIRMSRLLPAVVAVALLTACSGPLSIAAETGVDLPDALQSESAIDDNGPGAAWIDDRASLVVVLYGSSSCAPIPIGLAATDETSLVLDLVQSPNEACTADMAANTYRFDAPDGVAADGDVELLITSVYNGETTETTVPILE
jgi:hypothetical protein